MDRHKPLPINGGGPQSPCRRGCPNRSATCHISCEAYLAFAEERARFRKERFMAQDVRNTVGRKYTNAYFDRKAKLKRDGRQIDK